MGDTNITFSNEVLQVLRSDGTMTKLTTQLLKFDALLRSITDFIRSHVSEATENVLPTVASNI